jgi:hypothetical protein
VSTAFQTRLVTTGPERKWTLISQMTLKSGGKSIRPDGAPQGHPDRRP